MNTTVKDLKKGDFISETQYYQVLGRNVNSINGSGVNLVNERKNGLTITDGIIEEATFSADQFDETKKVSATELATIFSEVGDTVFTVAFNKLPQAKEVNEALKSINKGQFLSNNVIQEVVHNSYKGELRILRGYMLKIESLMGRAKVVDLDVKFNETTDAGYRLVDLRTLQYLIYKNVKYVLKS